MCGSSVFCLLPCFVSNNDPVGHVKYAWQHWPTWMLSYHFHVLSFWYLCVCLGMCIRGYVRPWTRKIRPFELCDMKIFYAWRWLICVSSDHYLSIFRCFFFSICLLVSVRCRNSNSGTDMYGVPLRKKQKTEMRAMFQLHIAVITFSTR